MDRVAAGSGHLSRQETGSVTQFSLIFLASTLPAVLVVPFARDAGRPTGPAAADAAQ